MYQSFTDAGYRIFPLNGFNASGYCLCGDPDCQAAGKHPIPRNWQNTPAWSDEQIEAMEEAGQLDFGYGVLVKGLLVIDVDERNGGEASYQKLLADIPEISGAGMVVRTGSGGKSKHIYFSLDEDTSLIQTHSDYPGIDFKSSGFVVGPGSKHVSGGVYEAVVGEPGDITPAPQGLINLLSKPDTYRAEINGQPVDVSDDDIVGMLQKINPACDYDTWIRIGMAIHHAMGGDGFDIWQQWSEQSETNYAGDKECWKHWQSFGKAENPVTLGTLAHYAEKAGWRPSVTFTSDVYDAEPEYEEEAATNIDTSGVDLRRPPGVAGSITQWINEQSRFPRENLATAAALTVLSSVAGMRHVDPVDGITANMFLFGVAGSATGKESILKSVQTLLRKTGLSPAVHGNIKSEQEIYRNLIRHQAAIYLMDEMAESLGKIQNARKGGGASYLEGVIGTLLSIYSKADGHALVTGDLKQSVIQSVQDELKALDKKMDRDGATDEDKRKMESLKNNLANINEGIPYPYLNIFGLTTPERFEAMMDADMAANGFLGRSLIFRELEDNPRPSPRKQGNSNLDSIANELFRLYSPGRFDQKGEQRVERIGEVCEIDTRPDALKMLRDIEDQFWHMAEKAKNEDSTTVPIPRRGYEQVAKVSFVLAIPEGIRTTEHVRWAYALVRRDITEKMRIVRANREHTESSLQQRILSLVRTDHGETIGRIRNKCESSHKPEDVDTCVERMLDQGLLYKYQPKGSGRGRPPSAKFFACKDS